MELPGPALAYLGGFSLHSLSSQMGFLCLHPLRISAVVPALAELCGCEGAQDGCLLPLLHSCGAWPPTLRAEAAAGSGHTFLSHQVAARDLYLPS